MSRRKTRVKPKRGPLKPLVLCPDPPKPDSKWPLRFLRLAYEVGKWSKDPSTKQGAVIVDDERRVLSLGYNGFPRGMADTKERLENRALKYGLIVHAEANAILNASMPVRGGHLYAAPLAPCTECAKLIIQAGIRSVCSPRLPDELKERWGKQLEAAEAMLVEGGVSVWVASPLK